MDELTKQLEQILNDPGSLSQIMDLANNLGIGASNTQVPELAPEMAARVNRFLSQNQVREQKQQALVRALLPYLRPGRQARLERAMQIAHLSHLAGVLGIGTSQTAGEEQDHV